MWRLALLLCIVAVPSSAFAWRQTQTCLAEEAPAPTATPFCTGNERPQGLAWPTSEVHYSVNERGSDDFPTADGFIDPELLGIINASFDVWSAPCSPFMFVYDGLTSIDSFDRADGVNVVVFKDDTWPYGSMALAITTVTAMPDGTITNADMEFNGVEHEFAVVTGNSNAWDVQNTITHEAGHILGLDHDAVPDSTMEFEAQRGETKKRDLLADDLEGLCAIYPFVEEMEPADPPSDDGCCGTVSGGSGGSWWPLAGILVMLTRRRWR